MSIPQILQMIQWTNTRIKYISPEVATIQNSNEIGKFSIKDRRTEQNRTEQNGADSVDSDQKPRGGVKGCRDGRKEGCQTVLESSRRAEQYLMRLQMNS